MGVACALAGGVIGAVFLEAAKRHTALLGIIESYQTPAGSDQVSL